MSSASDTSPPLKKARLQQPSGRLAELEKDVRDVLKQQKVPGMHGDCTSLMYLDEANILKNLRGRYEKVRLEF